MRSPDSRIRIERGLRAGAFGLLGFCAWAVLTDAGTRGREDARDNRLASDLVAWSRQRPADTIALRLAAAPTALHRDWLRALDRAGTGVTWSGALVPTALEIVPVADPAGGFVALAAAPDRAWLRLADSLGTIDSARVTRTGAVFRGAAHTGALHAIAGGQVASSLSADSANNRRAVVLGRAGWETRFLVTALEERGWLVDARLTVAPGIAVTEGRPLPLDTARHAVVIATDSLAAFESAGIARFVASGGGAVLGPDAARTAGALAAGRVGAHVRAPTVAFTSASPRSALALDPVVPRDDALALERQGGHVVLAARRVQAGRVIQLGFRETWRWRLGGAGDAVEQHRDWWAGVVAAAAYRSDSADQAWMAADDRAPLAALVSALGPASASATGAVGVTDLRNLLVPAAVLMFLLLLIEWSSRRLRGAA